MSAPKMRSFDPETPPRAWGRPLFKPGKNHDVRNTPTGVGKTRESCLSSGYMRKHPHGRGEDAGAYIACRKG